MGYKKRCKKAIAMAVEYGQIDGGHHKTWVIDQMVRILADDKYEDVITSACAGEDGPDTYLWSVGVAP